MRGEKLKFQRLLRMSKVAISRKTVNWDKLRAISQKMSALMKNMDTANMAETDSYKS